MTRPSTGLVGTRANVVPGDWEAHHIPTVDRTRQIDAMLYSGPSYGEDRYVYDPETDSEQLNTGTLLWEGMIRLQRMERGGGGQESGGQTVTTGDYLGVLPDPIPVVTVGMYVAILGPSALEQGTILRVADVIKGSLRWERDLVLTENLG